MTLEQEVRAELALQAEVRRYIHIPDWLRKKRMITITIDIYPDDPPDARMFYRQVELPDDAGEPLILSAVRDMALEWLAERKKDER